MTNQNPPIFDGHNDTLTQLPASAKRPGRSFFELSETGHIDYPRAKQGGLGGGIFAIFTPTPENSPEHTPMWGMTFTDEGYQQVLHSAIDPDYARGYTDGIIDSLYALEAEGAGRVKVVTDASQLEDCLAKGVLAMVLHFEGAEAIYPDLSNLEAYYKKGLRSLGLVWSRPNAFGTGVPFSFPLLPDTGPGMTPAGKDLVRACNRLGILVDLSHLNEKGFREVAELSSAPLVASHSNVHSICPTTRNLTDAQIDAIGRSGGIIGLNFEVMFIRPESKPERDTPLEFYTRHIDYIVNRIGIDHVGFGSDFDGADMSDHLKDAAAVPGLLEALRNRGYDQEALEKIAYKNWLRVFRATWK